MSKPALLFGRRVAGLVLAGSALAAVSLRAPAARAEFAPAPESPYRGEDPHRSEPPLNEGRETRVEPWEPPAELPRSTFRFHVGPALLLGPPSPGLLTALDIGQRGVGARLSAAWLRAASEHGLAAYSGELWIDFRHRYELHPIVGAGASFVHGGGVGQKSGVGAGVVRGALEYELPIAEADARVSLELIAWVPAIGTERTQPWAIAALTVGASF